MAGKVYIIGAGPGDRRLVTQRALDALALADCVVYDRLANQSLLDAAPTAAERIYVGKRPGDHARSQEEINRLLVEKALAGRAVVRLKGGDPLLFGRGGEEADALADAGVPFEIVPGVTAALAAAAFAGVPLTDRRNASCVTFVTGREGDGGSEGVDWRALARTGGTLVIYMGRGGLAGIVGELIAGGLDASTPAVIVENASLPSQRSLAAPLGRLAAKADEAGLAPPCLTIVGQVAAHYPRLAWFEHLPLHGKRVCVTRPRGAEEKLGRALEDLGAEVLRLPTIEIVPAGEAELRAGLMGLARCAWVVLTSAHGVSTLFDTLAREGLDARALAGKRVAAVGSATSAALAARGIRADLVPETFTGDALLEEMLAGSARGQVFVLWRAAGAREALADGLREAGCEVNEVAAYEAVMPSEVDAALVGEIRARPPSAVLFSSGSTAVNFVKIIGEAGARRIAAESAFVSIGPVTSEALGALGLPVTREASVHTSEGLLAATVDALAAGKGGAAS